MKDLTKDNIYKTFLLFAIPLVLSGFLAQAYQIIDTVIAGRYLGADGIAAIGATASCIQLISSLFWGFATGTSVYIAMLFGAKDYDNLKSSVYSNFVLYSGVIIAVAVILIAFQNQVFNFLQVDESIRHDTGIYYTIYLSGIVLILLNHFGISVLNALGISGFCFGMSIVSTALNIGGNLISVAVLDAGVAGLAASSVFAGLVVDVCYFFKIRDCLRKMGLETRHMQFSKAAIRRTFSFSVPPMIQQTVMYASSFLISPLINGLGAAATAAYTVVHRLYEINANVYQNSAKTITTYTAQCVGAKKFDKIKKGVGVALIQGIAFLLPLLFVCSFFAEEICTLFFSKGYTGDSLAFSVAFAKYFLPFILFNVINNLFHAFYRGVKCMNLLVVLTTIGSVARLIASFILVRHYGIYGVYGGWVLSWIIEAVFCSATYFMGAWKKNL